MPGTKCLQNGKKRMENWLIKRVNRWCGEPGAVYKINWDSEIQKKINFVNADGTN